MFPYLYVLHVLPHCDAHPSTSTHTITHTESAEVYVDRRRHLQRRIGKDDSLHPGVVPRHSPGTEEEVDIGKERVRSDAAYYG